MLDIPFVVRVSDVEERRAPDEPPDTYVERLAVAKARAVREPETLMLAGDTVVVLEGDVLEKPRSTDEAQQMLLRLAGREHEVLSALALLDDRGQGESLVARATVRFRPFGAEVASAYVATGEPMDKAGAYGIQSLGAALVEHVEGDFYTVMGMSVAGLMTLFERMGMAYRFGVRTD